MFRRHRPDPVWIVLLFCAGTAGGLIAAGAGMVTSGLMFDDPGGVYKHVIPLAVTVVLVITFGLAIGEYVRRTERRSVEVNVDADEDQVQVEDFDALLELSSAGTAAAKANQAQTPADVHRQLEKHLAAPSYARAPSADGPAITPRT